MLSWTHILWGSLIMLALAWFWHGRGQHERALKAVRRYCIQQGLILLDDTVVLHQVALLTNQQGKKHLVRYYHFDFTLNGLQRHQGTLTLAGAQVLKIELPTCLPESKPIEPRTTDFSCSQRSAQIIQLSEWRRLHPKTPKNREQSQS